MQNMVSYPLPQTERQIALREPVLIVSFVQIWDETKACYPRGIADTSRIAYDKIKASGKLSRQQEAMVAFFRDNGGAWTRQEFSQAAKWGINTCCGRAKELLDVGVLRELPRRACAVTGEQAHPLVLI